MSLVGGLRFGGVFVVADDVFVVAGFVVAGFVVAGFVVASAFFGRDFFVAKGSTLVATWLVALRQTERVLGDVVEHHLATEWCRLVDASDEPQIGEAIFEGEAVAAMDLNCLVKRPQG